MTKLVSRRPLKVDPANPLEDWLSGALTVRHPDGRLRRAKTLWKYAWCLGLIGHGHDAIVAALAARDAEPGYGKFTYRTDGAVYRGIATQVLKAHDNWAAAHPGMVG